MTDRALVIGIDHYAKSDWHLRAAVRDAVAFAKWVTEPGAGRASPETLTLLLSPHPDRPVTELPFQQATTRARGTTAPSMGARRTRRLRTRPQTALRVLSTPAATEGRRSPRGSPIRISA